MLQVIINSRVIKTNFLQFSDGAITYKLEGFPKSADYVSIHVPTEMNVSHVREHVEMVMSALSNQYGFGVNGKVSLYMPYLPYARADRKFEEGNPTPLDNFLRWLDKLQVRGLIVEDVHNIKAVSKYRVRVREVEQLNCLLYSLPWEHKSDWDVVVAPDKGAAEKAKQIADFFKCDIVYASKERDLGTGKLKNIQLPDYDFSGKKVLIPDDIYDAGGTFLWTADLLRKAGASVVDLYITHLIASKGLEPAKENIDTIYFKNVIGSYINELDVTKFNERKG